MKKLYALTVLLCLSVLAFGQYREGLKTFLPKDNPSPSISKMSKAPGDVYYAQDFEGEHDMTFIDNDGLAPDNAVAEYTSNWTVVDGVAMTTSWLTEGNKTSDNWMITPLIELGTQPYLAWDAITVDPDWADGYEVLISTTGNAIADFSTVVFSINAENVEWTKRLVDLKSYEGQEIYIAFHHNSTDKYLLGIDNILVKHLQGFDVSMDSYSHKKYLKPDEETSLAITFENEALDTLESVNLNYSVNNGPVQTMSVDGLKIPFGGKGSYVHNDVISATDAGNYELKIWLSDINGGNDDDNSNDTLLSCFYVVASDFQKTVLFEEFTGTWCGWCPGGFVILEELLASYDNMIGVCLHAGDTMQTEETLQVAGALGTFYPGGSVDRFLFNGAEEVNLDRGNWESKIIERLTMAVPVNVDFSFTYNDVSREIVVDASAQFSQQMSEDFRFNCYIVENGIDDDDPAFNQQNYYFHREGYEDHPYYNIPSPVTDFIHNHVVRDMLGGAWGAEGSIPDTVEAGETYTHQFTTTLPENFNPRKVKLVVFVQEYDADFNRREIHNAAEKNLYESSIAIFEEDGTEIEHDGTITVNGSSTDTEFGVRLSVQNIAETTTSISVTKEVIEEVDGTSNTFCWDGSCFANDVMVSATNAVMGPDSINTDFRADIAPDGNVGEQTMRYTFTNADNAKDNISVLVVFDIADGTSISQFTENKLKYWPNPVNSNELLYIDLSSVDGECRSVKLFDNTSRLLLDYKVEDDQTDKLEINLSRYSISSGTYYLILNSDKGNIALPVLVVE